MYVSGTGKYRKLKHVSFSVVDIYPCEFGLSTSSTLVFGSDDLGHSAMCTVSGILFVRALCFHSTSRLVVYVELCVNFCFHVYN